MLQPTSVGQTQQQTNGAACSRFGRGAVIFVFHEEIAKIKGKFAKKSWYGTKKC